MPNFKMEKLIDSIISEWGVYGLLIIMSGWIVYTEIKKEIEKFKNKSNDTPKNTNQDKEWIQLLGEKLDLLTNNIDAINHRVTEMDNKFQNKINNIETKISEQPEKLVKHIYDQEICRENMHSKQMHDVLMLGPKLHNILSQSRIDINADHILVGSFHNGTNSVSGIPYYKFDIIAEKFDPDNNKEDDIEFAPLYKDVDILRHNLLPIKTIQLGQVYYVINENNSSELKSIDDILYRRLIGRGIKQIAFNILNDSKGFPSGFICCLKYNMDKMNLKFLSDCAKDLEILYKLNDKK